MHNLELGVGGGRHSLQVQRSATSSLPLLNLISTRRVLEVPPQPGSQPRKGGSCSAWNAAPAVQGPTVPSSSCCSSGRQQLCSARPSPPLLSARQVLVLQLHSWDRDKAMWCPTWSSGAEHKASPTTQPLRWPSKEQHCPRSRAEHLKDSS